MYMLDEAAAQLIDCVSCICSEAQIPFATHHVASCMDFLAKQPGLSIEHSGVAVAAWPLQPQLELPYVAKGWLSRRFKPGHSRTAWQSLVMQRFDQHYDRIPCCSRKIDDAYLG